MNLIVDLNNIAFATRFAKVKNPPSRRRKEKFVTESLLKEILQSIVYHANHNQCTGVVIAQDSKKVWRKDVYPLYKESSTTDEDVYYSETLAAADLVVEYFRDNTSAYVLATPKCEADDVIAIWCQSSSSNNLILSTDKDYIQLVNDKTKLYSPVQRVFRETDDPQFDLFVKCIRGDKNDNIRSAFPRVRVDKLRKAWDDDYELLNLLETVRPDGTKVGEAFDLNQKLIDLSMQPDSIRQAVINTINSYQPSVYSELGTMKWLADKGLKTASNMMQFKDKCLKSSPIF